MGYKTIILLSIVSLLVAGVMQTLIRYNYFTRLYDHFPGKCTKIVLNGSEDFALFPNDHVLVSSGLEIFGNKRRPPAAIFMLDLKDSNPEPVKLTFDRGFLTENSPDFNPHGLGTWITDKGEYILYVINHRKEVDSIDSFVYHPDRKALVFRNSIAHPELYNLNDVVAVGKDAMYVTRDHYFKHHTAQYWEIALGRQYGSIMYVQLTENLDGKGENVDVKEAADGFWYSNGIAKSNDGRFVYINECSLGTVTALTRNADNTLSRLQTIYVGVAPDNTFVSPVNGHLWIGLISKPFEFGVYKNAEDPQNTPVGGQALHVAIDESAKHPFDEYNVEEVFSTSGRMIGATSSALYHNKKLLIGTIRTGLMVCDVNYLIYD